MREILNKDNATQMFFTMIKKSNRIRGIIGVLNSTLKRMVRKEQGLIFEITLEGSERTRYEFGGRMLLEERIICAKVLGLLDLFEDPTKMSEWLERIK